MAFTHSITGALSSTLNICAFVLFFTVVIRMLFLSGVMGALAGGTALCSPLGLDQAWAQRLITGLLELSSGVSSLTGAGTVTGRLSMAAFMLGWAGLSVHCQVLAFLGDSGLSLRTYLTGKLLHGGLSALFTALLVRRFPLEAPVSSTWRNRWRASPAWTFSVPLTISTAAAWGVWLLFVALAVYMVKKAVENPGQREYNGPNNALGGTFMGLFQKRSNPRCTYCARGRALSEDQVICDRKGVMSAGSRCRSFKYDPLKRVPPPPG